MVRRILMHRRCLSKTVVDYLVDGMFYMTITKAMPFFCCWEREIHHCAVNQWLILSGQKRVNLSGRYSFPQTFFSIISIAYLSIL